MQRAPKRKPKVKDPDADDDEDEEEIKELVQEGEGMEAGIENVNVSAKWGYIEANSDQDDVSSNGSNGDDASPM